MAIEATEFGQINVGAEFRLSLRGDREHPQVDISVRDGLWIVEGDGLYSAGVDPRTALIAAMGLNQGKEIFNSQVLEMGGGK